MKLNMNEDETVEQQQQKTISNNNNTWEIFGKVIHWMLKVYTIITLNPNEQKSQWMEWIGSDSWEFFLAQELNARIKINALWVNHIELHVQENVPTHIKNDEVDAKTKTKFRYVLFDSVLQARDGLNWASVSKWKLALVYCAAQSKQ